MSVSRRTSAADYLSEAGVDRDDRPIEAVAVNIAILSAVVGFTVTALTLMGLFIFPRTIANVFAFSVEMPLLGTTYPVLSLLLFGTGITGLIGLRDGFLKHRTFLKQYRAVPFVCSGSGFISVSLAAGDPFIGTTLFGVVGISVIWVLLYGFKRSSQRNSR